MTVLQLGIILNLLSSILALLLLHLFPSDHGITITIAMRTRFIEARLFLVTAIMLVSCFITFVMVLRYGMKAWIP